jgi:hypothetical protein
MYDSRHSFYLIFNSMKKILSLSLLIFFALTACKNKKAEYTLLGDGTPYYIIPEKLSGNVNKVIEKNYWAIPDGESFKKGKALTKADRDSLGGWTLDFEATFDNAGDLSGCIFLDENNKATSKYEIYKENNTKVTGKSTENDTLRYYDKYKLDKNGKRIGFVRYDPVADTMVGTFDIKTNSAGDTLEYHLVNSKGESRYKLIVASNGLGKFTRSEGYNKDGLFQYANEVKFNDKGTVSELTLYNKDKKVTAVNYFTYEYDNKGNWVRAIVKDNKGFVVIEERAYTYFE